MGPTSDVRARSSEVDRSDQNRHHEITRLDKLVNERYNSHTRIAQLQCGYVRFWFSVVSGLEVAWRIENGGLMPGKKQPLGLLGPLQPFHQKQLGAEF